jgi:hypothetical protein
MADEYPLFTTNRQDLDWVSDRVEEMEKAVNNDIQKNNWTEADLRDLIGNWTSVGMVARGDGYRLNVKTMLLLASGGQKFGQPASKVLLARLKALKLAIDRSGDWKMMFHHFQLAEEAFRALLIDYREKLGKQSGHQARADFEKRMIVSIAVLDPGQDDWRTRGD